ncbi:MAG: hypothetical protein Q9187_001856 [Circinaria calcarea]
MASSTSSLPSQAPDVSLPSLEALVSHLLAAKRSLSSVDHVYRANDIVTATRQSLESTTVEVARTKFLQNESFSQIEILEMVQNHSKSVAQECVAEFQSVIKGLDTAESRLRRTLNQLRSTMVEVKLRPEGEERRSLIDFVDETGVQALLGMIKESIDATGEARKEYENSNAAMEREVSSIKSLLGKDRGLASIQVPILPIPIALHHMEEHAKEMADNLESLVNHFDLCVTAIKHMEGGNAAAQRIAADMPEGVDLGLNMVHADKSAESISEEEKRDMLQVLERDSNEVEDVVSEIRDRRSNMEARFERIGEYNEHLADESARTIEAVKLLEKLASRLPSYTTQSHLFLFRWDEEKTKIEQRMEDLEDLRDFYEGFIRAYDNLIVEVSRRKSVEVKVAKVLQDAVDKLNKLCDEEVANREAFKHEQGDFLPIDIWPGLMKAPTRFSIYPVNGSAESVPDLSKPVIQEAVEKFGGKSSKNIATR